MMLSCSSLCITRPHDLAQQPHMPTVPLHVVLNTQSRYLNFHPCAIVASACMPMLFFAFGCVLRFAVLRPT